MKCPLCKSKLVVLTKYQRNLVKNQIYGCSKEEFPVKNAHYFITKLLYPNKHKSYIEILATDNTYDLKLMIFDYGNNRYDISVYSNHKFVSEISTNKYPEIDSIELLEKYINRMMLLG
jgi:hypothetical protein